MKSTKYNYKITNKKRIEFETYPVLFPFDEDYIDSSYFEIDSNRKSIQQIMKKAIKSQLQGKKNDAIKLYKYCLETRNETFS